jgi:hypothetical protein
LAHGRKYYATAARQKDPAKIVQIGARRRRLLIATATTKSQNASGGVAAWHAGVTCNGRATGHISSLNVYTPWHMNASPPWRFADESSTLTTDSRTDTANCILMANEPHAGTQDHSSPACPRWSGLQSSRGAGGARAPPQPAPRPPRLCGNLGPGLQLRMCMPARTISTEISVCVQCVL